MNYRTVQSFGHHNVIIKSYAEYIEVPFVAAIKKSQCIGFWFGFSQFVQNAVFALLYYTGAEFNFNDPNTKGEDIFRAIFAMMFGAFAAG